MKIIPFFLAKQISDDFQAIVNDLLAVPIFSAKKKADDQETALSNGCDILVATPDRLKEFIDNEKVDLSEVKHVVIDEVDRMLDSTVVENIKQILKTVFTSGNLLKIILNNHLLFVGVIYIDQETKTQLVVFSESFPDSVRKLTKKYFSADFVTLNLADAATDEAEDDDEEEVRLQ